MVEETGGREQRSRGDRSKSLADAPPAPVEAPANAAKGDTTSGAVAQPSYAPEPPAAPPAKAQVASVDTRKNEEDERTKKVSQRERPKCSC